MRPITVNMPDPETGEDRMVQLAPDQFPCRIGVYCDTCGTTVAGDYVVSESMTKPQRLEVARAHLRRREGWRCDQTGDYCPCTATPNTPTGEQQT